MFMDEIKKFLSVSKKSFFYMDNSDLELTYNLIQIVTTILGITAFQLLSIHNLSYRAIE